MDAWELLAKGEVRTHCALRTWPAPRHDMNEWIIGDGDSVGWTALTAEPSEDVAELVPYFTWTALEPRAAI